MLRTWRGNKPRQPAGRQKTPAILASFVLAAHERSACAARLGRLGHLDQSLYEITSERMASSLAQLGKAR
jgi:hypothetical protein